MTQPPLINVGALVDLAASAAARVAAAREIDAAARSWGFFYAAGHGVDEQLLAEVVRLARAFFAQDTAEKLRIPMSAGATSKPAASAESSPKKMAPPVNAETIDPPIVSAKVLA